jgi:TolA-binding protein
VAGTYFGWEQYPVKSGVLVLVVLLLAAFTSSCSAPYMRTVPPDHKPGDIVRCSGYSWPIADLLSGSAFGIGSAAAFVGYQSAGYGFWINGKAATMALGLTLSMVTLLYLASSGYGFYQAGRCGDATKAANEKHKIVLLDGPQEKHPAIALEKKTEAEEEEDQEQEPEDLTGPMKFDLPMMEERKARMKSLEEMLLEEEIKHHRELPPYPPRNGPAKADMLFRLANRYYCKSILVYERELKEYDAKLKEWEEGRKRNPNVPKPVIRDRGSKVWIKAAFDVYRVLLRSYKNYRRRDEVLFVFAYGLIETGEKQEGVERYRQLIKEHPASIYVSDAYLALGEHYFDAGDYMKAIEEYVEAAKYKGIKTSFLAMYKLAWCHFRLGDKAVARELMMRVATEAKAERIRERAKRELEAVFAE